MLTHSAAEIRKTKLQSGEQRYKNKIRSATLFRKNDDNRRIKSIMGVDETYNYPLQPDWSREERKPQVHHFALVLSNCPLRTRQGPSFWTSPWKLQGVTL